MKNKILIDLERLRYPNSGIANVFRNLAKGIENQSNVFKVFYFGPKKELQKNIENKKIINYQKWHKLSEIFSQRFDIIHISHQLGLYFRKNYKNSIKIVTLHDLNFLHENLGERKKEKLKERVNKNLKNADYIVCISNFVKEDFLKNKHLFELKKLKDILVIHNGIKFPDQAVYPLGKFDFLKDKKYIVSIGVLLNKKNQKTLIEMLPYIESDLVLIFSEEEIGYFTEIKETIKKLQLENRVHFLKNVSEEEKYAVLQHCQALCHPSIAEGFGIPPIEAMAFGKPVFLSNRTSLPEIGGAYAFYFDTFEPEEMANVFTNGMAKYNQNPKESSEQIKLWATQFDYRTMAKKYLELYAKALKL